RAERHARALPPYTQLFRSRQQIAARAENLMLATLIRCGARFILPQNSRRKTILCRLKAMSRQCDLFQIVLALGSPGGFAGGLNGGQQQCDQNRDDRDDDEQLDEREARSSIPLQGGTWWGLLHHPDQPRERNLDAPATPRPPATQSDKGIQVFARPWRRMLWSSRFSKEFSLSNLESFHKCRRTAPTRHRNHRGYPLFFNQELLHSQSPEVPSNDLLAGIRI